MSDFKQGSDRSIGSDDEKMSVTSSQDVLGDTGDGFDWDWQKNSRDVEMADEDEVNGMSSGGKMNMLEDTPYDISNNKSSSSASMRTLLP